MTNNYRTGANFERYLKKHFESIGHFCIRSAGSHGAVDLMAISYDHVHACQLKVNCYPSQKELLKFWKIDFPENVYKEIYVKEKGNVKKYSMKQIGKKIMLKLEFD
jgi:hypothetical protein